MIKKNVILQKNKQTKIKAQGIFYIKPLVFILMIVQSCYELQHKMLFSLFVVDKLNLLLEKELYYTNLNTEQVTPNLLHRLPTNLQGEDQRQSVQCGR